MIWNEICIIEWKDDKMNIEKARKEVDKIDRTIISLLKKRSQITGKIGKYKMKNSISIYQPKREKEILSKIRKQAKTIGLDQDFAENIIKSIIRYCRSQQKP